MIVTTKQLFKEAYGKYAIGGDNATAAANRVPGSTVMSGLYG